MRRGVWRLAALLAAGTGLPAANAHWWNVPSPVPATPTPATSPTPAPYGGCAIDVLDREPIVPFDLIGLVEVEEQGPFGAPGSVLEAAKLRACQIGGHALVLLFRDESRRSEVRPSPRPRGEMLPAPALRAAVIRYRRP